MAFTPKYSTAKEYVLRLLKEQNLAPGDRLPSEAALAETLAVSSITIKKALGDLAREGVIYRVKGRGSFVSDARPTASSHMVAMVFSQCDVEDGAIASLILGAQTYLSRHNYTMVVECADSRGDALGQNVDRLLGQGMDGFIFYLDRPDDMRRLLDNTLSKRPVVLLDRKPLSSNYAYVGANNVGGAFEAVRLLVRNGHTRICFVGYDPHLNTELERKLGYAQALLSGGLAVDERMVTTLKDLRFEALAEAVRARKITALFAVNDRAALHVAEGLAPFGIRIPDDLSLVGFDNWVAARSHPVALTTVQQYFDAEGQQSARLLLQLIQRTARANTQWLLGTTLVERGSVKKLEISIDGERSK